jgi:hypothetical protein
MIKMKQVIKEYVKRFGQKYNDNVYNKYLKEAEKIGLDSITEKEVEEVIKPFLYQWGRMGRVLGRQKFQNWGSNLAKQIRSNYDKLEDFKSKDLVNINPDLSKFESDIKKCYESFKGAVGPIAAVKVLHLICPYFFPLWDNDIAKAIRNEFNGRNEKVEEFSGGDYYRFMQQIKDFIEKYKKVLSDLSVQYKKGKLKILDECLWWATHRSLSLFF